MLRERICEAIAVDSYTISSVATAGEVPRESLQRFCSGKQAGLQFDGVERLCDLLGLELVRRVNFAEHCNENWRDGCLEYDAFNEQYDADKSQAWEDDQAEAWEDFRKNWKGKGEPDYQEWADVQNIHEYPEWSEQYDADHRQTQHDGAREEFQQAERERLLGLEWVILEE